MKNTRIILFTAHYPYGWGEVFIANEIGYLCDAFQEVWVIPLLKSADGQQRALPPGAKLFGPLIGCHEHQKLNLLIKGMFNDAPFWTLGFKELFRKKAWKKPNWFRNWLSSTTLSRAGFSSKTFKSVLPEIEPHDIFYFYWGDGAANMLPMIRKSHQNFAMARFHNTDIYEENKGGYLPFRDTVLPGLDLAVFIAQNGLSYLQNRYPGILKNTYVSKLGVYDRGISKPSDGKILHLASCSALNDQKQVHLIPEALKQVSFPVKWVHFGAGPLMHLVENACKDLPAHVETRLMGHVPNIDVIRYYNEHPIDLFINVSKNEGIPVSIMEASAMGIPTIATQVGGVAEIVNNETGLLLDPNVTTEKITQMIEWFWNEAPREKMRTNARLLWQQNFDAKTNYQEFCNTIHVRNKAKSAFNQQ